MHPYLTPKWGQNILFSENGHNAYHIKVNDTYSNMQAIILCFHTLSESGVGSKGQNSLFFSENGPVAYQIKGMKVMITGKQIFCPYTPLTSVWGLKVKIFFFF